MKIKPESRTVIIGAGITGLTLAYELRKRGRDFVLVSDGAIGGVMGSINKDGFTLECGPQVLLQKPALLDLASELEIKHLLQQPNPLDFQQCVWGRERVIAAPRKPQDLLRSPLISISDLWRLAKTGLGVTKTSTLGDDESVARFFGPFIGEPLTIDLLAPILRGIYGGDVNQLSARSLFPKLWDHVKSTQRLSGFKKSKQRPTMSVFKGGSAVLINKLVESIEPFELCKDSVRSIGWNESSRVLEVALAGDDRPLVSDELFVCTAGQQTAMFIKELAPDVSDKLSQMSYASILVSHFSVPRNAPVPTSTFGVLFPRVSHNSLMGVMFTSEVFPCVAPPDRHLITCFSQANLDTTTTDIVRLQSEARKELADKFSIVELDNLEHHFWPYAIPQYEIGHHKLVSKLSELESQFPGLFFAGNDQGGIGVPDRISAAIAAVQKAERFGTSPSFAIRAGNCRDGIFLLG